MTKTVTEFCPRCEREATMEWDIERDGFKAFCPYCGGRLMLCDECRHGEGESDCDYSSESDSCRHNPPKQERVMTNEEKIKAMSREELAKLLLGQKAPYCAGHDCPEDHDCVSCVLEWLGEEAAEK